MRLTLCFSALALTAALLSSPGAALLGMAIGLGIVLLLACGAGIVAFVRIMTEEDA